MHQKLLWVIQMQNFLCPGRGDTPSQTLPQLGRFTSQILVIPTC